MKATIDIDDSLYRRLKIEAARRDRTIRELVSDGIRTVLDGSAREGGSARPTESSWFGTLHGYASNAKGRHDLRSIRASIGVGRQKRKA